MIVLGILLCIGGVGALTYLHLYQAPASPLAQEETTAQPVESKEEKQPLQPPRVKTPEEKQAVIDARIVKPWRIWVLSMIMPIKAW